MARTDVVLLSPEAPAPPRPADAPILLTVGELDRPYQEIGFIRINGVTRLGYGDLNARLRQEARRVGADAVLFVRYGTEHAFSLIPFFIAIPYDVLTVEGLAVRSRR